MLVLRLYRIFIYSLLYQLHVVTRQFAIQNQSLNAVVDSTFNIRVKVIARLGLEDIVAVIISVLDFTHAAVNDTFQHISHSLYVGIAFCVFPQSVGYLGVGGVYVLVVFFLYATLLLGNTAFVGFLPDTLGYQGMGICQLDSR